MNLGIFSATWDQQANVDAQLTLGADVVATAPPGLAAKHDLAGKIARVPGVKATSALDHSYAYIGPDLQDTYGIDPASFTKATTLRDSYFIGGSADQMISRLRSTPDGIIVSKETITDYSLKQGDLLKLRVLDRSSGRFRVVPFHVIGTVQEFPSAPKDSFMVTNLPYLQRVSHEAGPNVVFAKTSGDPPAVSRRVAAATKADGAEVKNIREQNAQTATSITTVSLHGISRIEELFAIVLAAGAMGCSWRSGSPSAGTSSPRWPRWARRSSGSAPSSGARPRWCSAPAWCWQPALGWLLSKMLVAMLQHVFDPPPDALAIPWGFLGELAGAAVGATVLAVALAARGLRRLPLGKILREQ